MIIAIAILVSLGVGAFGGYKYGHSVASKAASEAAKVQRAVKDLR